MKKRFLPLGAILILILLISSTSCESNNTFVMSEDDYEYADVNWTPIGDEIKAGKFTAFTGDEQKVFIKEKGLFSEGIIYHKKSDTYPNIKTSKITKVILSEGEQRIEISEKYYQYFQKGLIDDIQDASITAHELAGRMLFVDIYFENYPAYYTYYYFSKTVNDELVLRYCEDELNHKYFGDYNASLVLTDNTLSRYVLQVFDGQVE